MAATPRTDGQARIASRIADALHPGRALVAYLTAADPTPEAFLAAARGAVAGGAAVLEVGVPYSDPVADGTVIQRAHRRALAAGGGVARTLDLIRELRTSCQVPIVLFTYLNPVLAYGLERFAREAAGCGANGVLTLDLAPEEEPGILAGFALAGLDPIVLFGPTTADDRLDALARHARGFAYVLARTGITGARAGASEDLDRRVGRVRAATGLPVAVGFGIASARDVRRCWAIAEAAVVGSALIAALESHAPAEAESVARAFIAGLRGECGATSPEETTR